MYLWQLLHNEIVIWILFLGNFFVLLGHIYLAFKRQALLRTISSNDREEELRISEEKFRSLSMASPVGIFQTDIEGKCIYTNPRWQEITGLTLEESLGYGWSNAIYPEDRERIFNEWNQSALEKREFLAEFRFQQPDGTVRWVRARAAQLKNGDKVVGYVGTDEDITELKDKEEEIQKAAALKSQFLANMSHEIRTPLSAITGFCELLRKQKLPLEDQSNALNIIYSNGIHLTSLINDILDIAKIDSGKLTFDMTLGNIREILNDVVGLMNVKAIEKGLQLSIDFDEAIPEVMFVDTMRLKQILFNLIGNAVKYTHYGSIKIKVNTFIENNNARQLSLQVIDTGIGMMAEDLEKLFQPFSQIDSTLSPELTGTGLGLFISKKLAMLLGGTLEVTSQKGVGSIMKLQIPLFTPQATQEIQGDIFTRKDSFTNSSLLEKKLEGLRILLVEDFPDNQKLMKYFLQLGGAHVDIAENGQRAIEIFDKTSSYDFNIILMDMQMPILDGYTATEILRKKGCNTPIIALTAHAMLDDKLKCMQVGCSDYLTKPVDMNTLYQVIISHNRAKRQAKPMLSKEKIVNDIISCKESDPAFQALVDFYIQDLPLKVGEIIHYASNNARSELCQLLHKIKGSASLYGFNHIAKEALELEIQLEEHISIEAVIGRINTFIQIMRNTRGYDRSLERFSGYAPNTQEKHSE
jgi:PAS domain S-box-containing protein